MPELPEVETLRLGLQNKIVGKKISDIEVKVAKIFQGNPKDIIGAKVERVERRAKILIIELDNGYSLVIHLKLTGQLVYHEKGSTATYGHPIPFAGTTLPSKTTHIIFTFTNGSKLFYNDVRKFGWIKVVDSSWLMVHGNKIIGQFGVEPFTKEFTLEKFKEIIGKKKMPIKLLLMDQTHIAGVGNIYANEALFGAKISPLRKSNEMNDSETERLYKALLEVLEEGIKYGGSSENAYVNVLGEKGTMQDHFKVYGKKGESCPGKCGGEIKRITQGGRGTFYCERCQT